MRRPEKPIPGFGKNGIVELWDGLDRKVEDQSDRIIFSGNDRRRRRGGRRCDARWNGSGNDEASSRLHPRIRRAHRQTAVDLPHHSARHDEFGDDTWKEDSWKYTGNTGAWAPISADLELGYVYLPIETPTGDYYGGHRPGDNLFGDSIVCLDAKTGKRIWHYQLIHHDIWDWDTASAPVLLDVTVDGRARKIVAQVTKQGFTYVFDRVTGDPIWPIVERACTSVGCAGRKDRSNAAVSNEACAVRSAGRHGRRPDRSSRRN